MISSVLSIDAINSITLSKNNHYIVSGSEDRSIRIFDFEKRKLLHIIDQAHESIVYVPFKITYIQGGVNSVALTSDTEYIVSSSNDGEKSLKVYDFKTRELAFTFEDTDDCTNDHFKIL